MSSNTSVKPCFAYPGGKSRLLKELLPRIPSHKAYVEPFAGGLAVLLAKPRSPVEVINDIDKDLVTFYRYVRFHMDALLGELEGYFQSRADFMSLLENPGYTDLQRAARCYLLKVCSFGGLSGSFGRALSSFTGFDRKRHGELIRNVSERIRRVVIECNDWESVVEFYDSPDTFHFFDPPYVDWGKTAYQPFTEFDMARVRNRVERLKGNWILTCDNSEICRGIFDGLPKVEVGIKYSTNNMRVTKNVGRKQSSELIILSPRLTPSSKAA